MLQLIGSWECHSVLIASEEREWGKKGRGGGEEKGGRTQTGEREMVLLPLELAPAMIT